MVLIVLDGRNCLEASGFEAGSFECHAVGSSRFVPKELSLLCAFS